ncbi:uncharacterized protein BDV14DRAFT_173976 [Aspergillus stella-maris]|uniref:uncharacterized protein n=1 Tax=Aspergillus stella-maris TaxID=1810926 RepID=UPI003CCDD55D
MAILLPNRTEPFCSACLAWLLASSPLGLYDDALGLFSRLRLHRGVGVNLPSEIFFFVIIIIFFLLFDCF